MEEKSVAIDVRGLSVDQIMKEYDSIQDQIEASEGYPSQELQEMKEFVTAVMENKVDQICLLRNELEANIEACKKQAKYNQDRLDLMDVLMEKVMKSMKVRELNGQAHRIAFRKSSSVNVLDEAKVPAEFKKYTVELKESFSAADSPQYLFWATVILKRHIDKPEELTEADIAILNSKITLSVMKAEIKKASKAAPIEGTKIEDNENVQYQIGKAKMKSEVLNA